LVKGDLKLNFFRPFFHICAFIHVFLVLICLCVCLSIFHHMKFYNGFCYLTASLDRPKTDMSKAEFAALLEKQHLKECEENDYMMLEGLFQARGSIDDTDESYEVNA